MTEEEALRKQWLAEAQRRNPPMDMERWAKMDPLEVYWEVETIQAKLVKLGTERIEK